MPSPQHARTRIATLLAPLLEKAALTAAINDAWLMIAVLTVAALLCVPFARSNLKGAAPRAA